MTIGSPDFFFGTRSRGQAAQALRRTVRAPMVVESRSPGRLPSFVPEPTVRMSSKRFLLVASSALAVSTAPLAGQQDLSDVVIETQEVADGIYMLTGSGGNMGLSVGEDGAFLIDDQFAPLTEQILAAVAEVSSAPVHFVLNTHWHGDHTGGNENLGEAGAMIVAHDNVRERLATTWTRMSNDEEQTVSPQPNAAIPVITFSESATFYWNGHELEAVHAPHAHTDGDAIIHFKDANVVHMGDTFFNGRYPFIDTSSGGSIDGAIHAMSMVLDWTTDDTRIIPGHGALATRDDLRRTRDMLMGVRDRVGAAMRAGSSLEDIVAMGVTGQWDADFGGPGAGADRLVAAVHQSLSN